MDKAQMARAAAAEQSFVKVGTQKLDMLVDLVGELVITQSLIAQSPHLDADAKQALARNFSHLHRVTKELQRSTMSMRMVPIRATFQKMNRIVRDVAAKQNKRVQLVLEGEGTELDRNIIEEIGDPLVHMIRNAVDHGLESPEEREAIGKPAEGRIVLRAFHQGGSIIIQIQDDGKGLNQERLFAKAVEKGLISSRISRRKRSLTSSFCPGSPQPRPSPTSRAGASEWMSCGRTSRSCGARSRSSRRWAKARRSRFSCP
jgi:two-component system chemotaxis sensor kinase CheA